MTGSEWLSHATLNQSRESPDVCSSAKSCIGRLTDTVTHLLKSFCHFCPNLPRVGHGSLSFDGSPI